jgi:parvulin-like peptidyl-prolyl isomerase
MSPAHLMKLRYPLLALPLVLVLAACGSGGGGSVSLNSGDVAAIGSQHVTKLQFDQSMKQQRLSLKRQGQKFPALGSTQFSALKNQVLSVLVQNAEFEDEAAKLGVKVSAKDVQTQLDLIKKQYFGGNEKRYQQQLKQQGYDDAEVRNQIRSQILSQRLFQKVTANVTASDKDVHAYYVAHESQYATKGSRDVRYILVGKNKQSLAQSLAAQLKSAPDSKWCAFAKKYSQDPSSKNNCGKATFQKGGTVPEFDKLLFSLPTKGVASVNSAQYGWFVLQPTTAAKPAGASPEKSVAATIRAQLEQQNRNQQMSNWVARITKQFCSSGKIKYQVGYQPNPDPCTSLATATNTTTT